MPNWFGYETVAGGISKAFCACNMREDLAIKLGALIYIVIVFFVLVAVISFSLNQAMGLLPHKSAELGEISDITKTSINVTKGIGVVQDGGVGNVTNVDDTPEAKPELVYESNGIFTINGDNDNIGYKYTVTIGIVVGLSYPSLNFDPDYSQFKGCYPPEPTKIHGQTHYGSYKGLTPFRKIFEYTVVCIPKDEKDNIIDDGTNLFRLQQ